jgi:hypothetical protein
LDVLVQSALLPADEKNRNVTWVGLSGDVQGYGDVDWENGMNTDAMIHLMIAHTRVFPG